MALKLIANYSKRLGLPGYSSHQFSISVETEIQNINDVAAEASRLYLTLQKSVDEEIQSTGFVPEHGYGTSDTPTPHQNGGSGSGNGGSPVWRCSDKQKALIGKLIADNGLERGDIESLSREMFNTTELHTLNKLQASGLIDLLIEEHGGKSNRRGTTPAGRYSNGAGRSR